MTKFPCPKCGKESISLMSKYIAGYWQMPSCPACHSRITAHPVYLPLMYIAYLWNWFFWPGLYLFNDNPMNFFYMVVVWLFLDVCNVIMIPLRAIRQGA